MFELDYLPLYLVMYSKPQSLISVPRNRSSENMITKSFNR